MRSQVTLFGSCLLVAASALAQQASTPAAHSNPQATAAAHQPAPPANPLTDAQAHELMEITGASKLHEQLEKGADAYFAQRLPFAPKDVVDDLNQSMAKLDLQTPVIALYKQHISTTDAASIIAFCKTSAGEQLLHAMPAIMYQSEQMGREMGMKTMQEVADRHKTELEAAAKQYQAEHAPKPAPSLNTPSSSGAAGASSAQKPQK